MINIFMKRLAALLTVLALVVSAAGCSFLQKPPEFEPMEIDLEVADRGRIVPCLTGFVENKWFK